MASQSDISKDHRLRDQGQYERFYAWLYFNNALRGYMCKICGMYYGSKPCSSGGNRGAWSHASIKFKKNPGKRIRCHEKSKDHKTAFITLTTIRMDKNLGNNTPKETNLSEERRKANTLYISKLI